ncbi:BafA family autotransporter [Bartonella raoultii]|uniref:BafA family autotransporter n=1 Tax=Bartonella raoultii TaxID=1457020 RepID=A0ABS7I993_9HYPH|nr:BafA family autotransporter [Bartonella raoultii]MBX4336188.1 BafA family autotransporter [Bartonella raoultii]
MQHKLKVCFCVLMSSVFFTMLAGAQGDTTPREKLLIPIVINEHLEETEKFLSKARGLKAKGENSKHIWNKERTEVEKILEEEGEKRESLFFTLLTSSIISDDTAVHITKYDSETSGKKVKSFNYQDAAYSINNIVQDRGKLYIDEASVSRDTVIESGGVEFVRNLSTSEYSLIKKAGKQIIENGANAEGAKIYGGEQIIYGKGLLRDQFKESSAYSSEISAEDGMPGIQNVYSGGLAVDTKVMQGGIQNIDGQENFNQDDFSENIDTEDEDFTLNEGAFALNTELFKNGMQNIFAGGNASEVTLYDRSIQTVYNIGYADTVTINHQAQSWLYAGAILDKETTINDFGSLYIYAGNGKSVTEVEHVILNGEDTKLYLIATKDNGKKPHVDVGNLSGSGRVIFTYTETDRYYSQLNVDNLSGQLHFDFNINLAEQLGDYLLIKKNSSGSHTISVTDSGNEMASSFHKKLKLINDRSGNAHFTLTNGFGEKIKTIDAGAYMYSLKQRKKKGTGKIWYLEANYALDEKNIPLFSDFHLKPSTDLFLDVLTERTIEKGTVVFIVDPSFDSRSEKMESNGEISIRNRVSDGGKLYVYNDGLSLYTVIDNGGIEVIKAHGLAQESVVNKGGQQKIKNGGKAEDTQIRGGEQFVSGKFMIEGRRVRSRADNTIISGEGEEVGYQNVYDGGIVFSTKIKEGGIQNLYVEGDLNEEDSISSAFDTEVFSDGEQYVLAGGEAIGVTLQGTALQIIDLGGYVKDLMINEQATSWLHHGATLEGNTTVNDSGRIYLYAGAKRSRTEVEKIILNGKDTKLYSISSNMDGDSSLIENLSGHGKVIFLSTALNPHYSQLEIKELSGHLHFLLHTNFIEQRGDYLLIKKASGSHKISVIDSGVEIANSPLQAQNFALELDLINIQSGDAHFILTDLSGEEVSSVDGGVYIYGLKIKNHNGEKIWYLSTLDSTSSLLNSPSHTEDSTSLFPKKDENTTSTRNFSINSDVIHFSIIEGGGILQSALLGDDHVVYISDDKEQTVLKQSINNTVQGSGILYVESGGFSKNTTVESGGSEVVGEQGISEDTIVYEGGQQRVEGGGTAIGVEIYGGDQFVSGDSYVNGGLVGSTVYSTTIHGQDKILGHQRVYDDGMAVETKIMEGGVQILAKWFAYDESFAEKSGGLAVNTEVFAGGMQYILAGGEADTVILHAGGIQEVSTDGLVKNLTIESEASSWVAAGAVLGGEITVHDFGRLYLDAGDENQKTRVENIDLNGEEAQLYFLANEFDDKSIHIEKLSGVGKAIFTSSENNNLHYSQLSIDDLSGSIDFHFNVSLAEEKGDYLSIKRGKGSHTVHITDSGIDIVEPSLRDLDLIFDQSGGANFTLKSFSGANIQVLDGGTYTYGLKQKSDEDRGGKVWYLSAVFIDNVPFIRKGEARSRVPRHLNKKQQGSIFSTLPISEEYSVKLVHRRASCQNLRQKSSACAPITIVSSKKQSIEQSHLADGSQRSDGHEPTVVSTEASLTAAQMVARPLRKEHSSPLQAHKEISVSTFLTTPSTDAVLSLSVTPGLMFHNELQAVRTGRGLLDKNKKKTSLWTYAIKSKESISADHIDFKLDQTGVLLGLGILNKLAHGEFSIGSFGGYDQARIAHARGGTSRINTYSVGAYATYFDESGWYLDGILKYNHYQNTLKAVSTNGLAIEGNYDQDAIGSSFEVGYRFKMAQSGWLQPYTQLRWLQVSGKEIKLSNGMTGSIDPFTSLRSEVGLSLGYEFGCCMETSSTAYITGAWLREHKENNHTRINQHHQFMTDLSGNAGKLGVGLSSLVSDKLKLYAEAHYIKGHKMKQSFKGALGMRYRF